MEPRSKISTGAAADYSYREPRPNIYRWQRGCSDDDGGAAEYMSMVSRLTIGAFVLALSLLYGTITSFPLQN